MTGLPQGWATARTVELCSPTEAPIQTGPFGSNLGKADFAPSGVPVFTIGALGWNTLLRDRLRFVSEEKASELADYRLKAGDLLFSRMADVGRVGFVPPDLAGAIFNYHIMRLRLNPEAVEPDFFRLYVLGGETAKAYMDDVSRGATRDGINTKLLAELPVDVPPLPEQQRIVRKLDTLSARSTTARSHLAAIEKLVERMRGAVLSQALNGRLVASQLDCGEPTELGQFITGIEQGWSPKCDNEPELDPTKWAVLTTTAIQAITFDSAENKRLPESLSPRPHLEVEAGDVLMTRAGPRVRCAVCCYVAETAPRRIFSDKIYRIRLDKSVEPEFFAMMMNAPEMVRALDAIKSGGSESGLNLTQDRLKSLAINIWDRPTQVEVVADIKRQFAKIDRLAAEAAKALKLLGHLDQRILAKAFAGDLVPQDPTEEPAETLLARIREARAIAPKGKRGRKAKA